jgi:hypothetical protein
VVFNEGGCGSVYHGASRLFREVQPLEEWMKGCQQIRRHGGYWKQLEIETVLDHGKSQWVRGSAVFAGTTYEAGLIFVLEDRYPRLGMLSLRNGLTWTFPDLPVLRPSHSDPPLPQLYNPPPPPSRYPISGQPSGLESIE